jgi:hypothetical protein
MSSAGQKYGFLVLVVFLIVFAAGCGAGKDNGLQQPSPNATLQSITIGPASPAVQVGQTLQLTATGNFSDGSHSDITSTASWNSTTPNLATVNSSGIVTGVAAGTANIIAAQASVSSSTNVVVSTAPPPPPPPQGATAGVTTWHNDLMRTGANTNETILTPANVGSGNFGKLFQYTVDGDAYAQPLYVPGLNVGGQVRNVVFIATQRDKLYAFDADGGTTQPLWQKTLLGPGETFLSFSDTGVPCCPAPDIGITGTPVIDTTTNTLYVVARSKKGDPPQFFQRLYAIDILTGNVKNQIDIRAEVPGTGDARFIPGSTTTIFDKMDAAHARQSHENQRAGLVLLGNAVYIAWGSHSDIHPYHGWIMAYDKSTLAQLKAVNITPNGQDGGIWLSGGAPASDGSSLFVVTGNGPFDPAKNNWAQAVLKMSPTLDVQDYFVPFNWSDLNKTDLDLSSGGVMLVPDQASPSPRLAITTGKDGVIYVLNRDNLGKFQAGSDSQIVQRIKAFNNIIRSMPAYWNGFVYFGPGENNDDVAKAYRIANGRLTETPVSQASVKLGFPGATPAVSANGNTNGIVWLIDNKGWGVLRAYDATDLSRELYNSARTGDGTGSDFVRFCVPTVMNGKVYVSTRGRISVYGLRQ